MTAQAPVYLQHIEIAGYRGFGTPVRVPLARPDGSKPGSGLTILVGANGSGKSTVLEALRFLQRTDQPPPLAGTRRNVSQAGRVNFTYTTTSGAQIALGTGPHGGGRFSWSGTGWDLPSNRVFTVPARRRLGPGFQDIPAQENPRDQYIQSTAQDDFRTGQPDRFGYRLVVADANMERFNSFFGRIMTPHLNWHLEREQQRGAYMRLYFNGAPFETEGIADGVASLFYIVDALYDSLEGDIIGIDDIDASLHPTVLRRLMKVLTALCHNRQIVISTHDALCIDWDAILSGASVVRFVNDRDGIRVGSISDDTRDLLRPLRSDRSNPHVLAAEANEIFFLDDGITLFEGQEDVQLYPRAFEQLPASLQGSVFGWGVGGANNMRRIAALLKDLGFRRVAGVLDKNKQAGVPALNAEFPEYLFVASPADDVRTKEAPDAQLAVDGLLDREGKLQPKYSAELQQLLDRVNHYLRTGDKFLGQLHRGGGISAYATVTMPPGV